MIYLDNGASSHPKPNYVIRSMCEWMSRNGANPGRSGHRLSMEAAELIYNTRCAAGALLGVSDAERVIILPGATYGLNLLLFGLLRPGDHVITTDLEHNSVLRPLWHLKNNGIEVTVVSVDFYNEENTVDKMMSEIRDNTKAIICTQCSNACGYLMPIERIAIRKPNNVLLIVDGAQGAGMLDINVEKMNIDYYCSPSHKGLLGPQGGGLLTLNNRPPDPLIYGGTGTESLRFEQPMNLPERLESGTISSPVCAGMLAGIKYINKIGIEKIEQKKRELTRCVYEALSKIPSVELYMFPVKEKCFSVIPFNIRGKDSDQVASYLNERDIFVRSGLHCAPLFHHRMRTSERGMVRISLGWFNTERDVDVLATTLKNM